MPFTKIKSGKDKGKYRSPSGRVFTRKQVNLYYASHGFERNYLSEIKRRTKRG
jgi:hypothetical protein